MEEKSEFTGSNFSWLKLIKTVVAFANTKGGELLLYNTKGVDPDEFDSARIDDRVNGYVEPRIQNVETQLLRSYVKIKVANSPSKPHVFKIDGSYQDPEEPSRQRNAFYKGQVLVRHSSKNEVATRDDYERMLEEKQNELMNRVKMVFEFPADRPVKIEENSEAMPVKVVKEGTGVPVLMKDQIGKKIRITVDPGAPAVKLEEKDILKMYPLTYDELTQRLRKLPEFKVNSEYHVARRSLEKNRGLCFERYLDPRNPNSTVKRFYSLRAFHVLKEKIRKRG